MYQDVLNAYSMYIHIIIYIPDLCVCVGRGERGAHRDR